MSDLSPSNQSISPRQSEILKLVKARGFVSVELLAEKFSVTTQTIRRDINRLSELGLLRRVHGGVDEPATPHNIAYTARKILNLDAKKRIASVVAGQIPDGASLGFSIGTTPEMVAQALDTHEGLKVYTNNINVAIAALKNPVTDVTIAGGRLRHGDRDVLGLKAEEFFKGYKFDIGIFGVAGVDADGTLLDFHEDEVSARQAILANCRRSYLVLDHSKFGRHAHVRGGWITDVTKIFVDREPPEAIMRLIAKSNAELVICNPDQKT
ncbi:MULTISPECIES: DeoR/GlpR family DNA-binding transcription regulator [Pseudovibrio]|uniref:DeoR/GlpR family DNA-binding transcription regulator n=1 Tax=Stappiaceae TaxID=2821832 RepID=UPI0023666006|nr:MULTISPECIES: DeoR/GlpR family DNA-binding transcription regulator [Pseudovibrio]MDD7909652.1 DeoR/GlpR family DNA-binding transcription regulator [Pseudovibrio exalbescens]MDX5591994.1 DeoR/GlpR family DNA-binding transcription regulator [Pseudovibrio sp. SPO723]